MVLPPLPIKHPFYLFEFNSFSVNKLETKWIDEWWTNVNKHARKISILCSINRQRSISREIKTVAINRSSTRKSAWKFIAFKLALLSILFSPLNLISRDFFLFKYLSFQWTFFAIFWTLARAAKIFFPCKFAPWIMWDRWDW